MKKIITSSLFIIICTLPVAGVKPAQINLSGTWAFGTGNGNVYSSGIIIYQKEDKIFADMSIISTPPATGFFINKKTVFLDFNNLGKFYGRVINDSYIEWTNNSFWQKRSGMPEKESAEKYDAMYEKSKSGSIKFTSATKEEIAKSFNPKVFDNVKIASSDKLAKGESAFDSSSFNSKKKEQPEVTIQNFKPENYREKAIRLDDLPAGKRTYADGLGRYYYLIAQENCNSKFSQDERYEVRGFVGTSDNNSNFCGKKMPPGYQVLVDSVLFIWGRKRSDFEFGEIKRLREMTKQPDKSSYSKTYFESSRYQDCMADCQRNQCSRRSGNNNSPFQDTAQKACSDSCARKCKSN